MIIPFSKFHGFGNDYIVIESSSLEENTDLSQLGSGICHRHTGAGADGIAVLERLDTGEADYFCEIVNPDGSIAGFSGNGTRCAVSYLYHKGVWAKPELRLMTRSGIKNYKLIEQIGAGEFWFEAEIGKPKFSSQEVPFYAPEPLESVLDSPVIVDGIEYSVSAVNIGNPVACVFVEEFDPEWRKVGCLMETHELFPDRANIVFVKVQHPEHIEIRIWERAAGETAASGTCSAGSAVLSALTGRTSRTVNVHSPGGVTRVVWRDDDDEIVLTGRADYVYRGEWPA